MVLILAPAPLPSFHDIIEAVNGICDSLVSTLMQIADIAAELEHRDHVRIDEIENVRSKISFNMNLCSQSLYR